MSDAATGHPPTGPDYEAFFRAVFPRAVAVAGRVAPDRPAAEDAAIEALAKAHVRWRRLADEPWREAWVFRVAVNEALRRLPRSPAQRIFDVSRAESADHAEIVVLRQTLAAALRLLPRRQCEVVVLRYLVGLSESQVGQALDISQGSVKTHLRRALARLRSAIGPTIKEEHLARLA